MLPISFLNAEDSTVRSGCISSIMYSKSALRSFIEIISLNIVGGKVHCFFSG